MPLLGYQSDQNSKRSSRPGRIWDKCDSQPSPLGLPDIEPLRPGSYVRDLPKSKLLQVRWFYRALDGETRYC